MSENSMDESPTTLEREITPERKFRSVERLTGEERLRYDRAHQLKVTTYHMLKECSATRQNHLIPEMKRIYLQACKQYTEECRKLGV